MSLLHLPGIESLACIGELLILRKNPNLHVTQAIFLCYFSYRLHQWQKDCVWRPSGWIRKRKQWAARAASTGKSHRAHPSDSLYAMVPPNTISLRFVVLLLSLTLQESFDWNLKNRILPILVLHVCHYRTWVVDTGGILTFSFISPYRWMRGKNWVFTCMRTTSVWVYLNWYLIASMNL